MMGWNILATAYRKREKDLLCLLESFGKFKGSGYRDVVLGNVVDVHYFFEKLEAFRREYPEKMGPLSRTVPIDKTFRFDVTDFEDKLKEAISSFAKVLENRRFYVRVVRRGHKGVISSQEVEKEMDDFIKETLQASGKQAEIDFENPDIIIVVETIENRAGVGIITSEMKRQYPFIRSK